MEDLKPQQKLGQYTVLRKLAEGGMAEIYLASRGGASGFSKSCVIKRVKAQHRTDEKFREMFELEAKLAANLEHSNIVQIFDFQSSDDGELYLAMQYVDGCSLEELRKRLPGYILPPFLAARIARDVSSALWYAFSSPGPDGEPLGLVHRDISPHNVLVSRQGEVKLTDFGIAKPISKETTGGFKGKIAYMAPEQARGGHVDARTDIFALGVVLFELCTGVRPFDAPTDIAFIHEMASGAEPAPRASSLGTPIPEELEEILDKALQRQPEHRFQTADELHRALDQFLRSAPSEVDVDLGRFVTERLGSLSTETPSHVPQLQSGAFEDTRLAQPRRKTREPTAMMTGEGGDAADGHEGGDASGTPPTLQAISRSQAAPQAPVMPVARPADRPKSPLTGSSRPKSPLTGSSRPKSPLGGNRPDNTTFRGLPAFEEDPARPQTGPKKRQTSAGRKALSPPPQPAPPAPAPVVAESTTPNADAAPDEPRPLFTKGMKLALGVAVPLVLIAGAVAGLQATRKHGAQSDQVVVKVPPPDSEQKPKPPEPAKTEPAKPEQQAKVEAKDQTVAKTDPTPDPTPHPDPRGAVHSVTHPAVHTVAKTGKVVLSCTPYAEVYDGSKKISDDGIEPVVLPAGPHHLHFKYENKWATLKLDVPPDGQACAVVSFTGQAPVASAHCPGR